MHLKAEEQSRTIRKSMLIVLPLHLMNARLLLCVFFFPLQDLHLVVP